MTHTSSARTRARGLAAAIRVARTPVICALLVALASEATLGKAIPVAVALAAVTLGVAVHAREIFLGRGEGGAAPAPRARSTGEWVAGAR